MKKKLVALVVAALVISLMASTVWAQGVDPGTGVTNIFMQNLGSSDAQVRVLFYPEDVGGTPDWDYTLPDTIPPLGSKYLLFPDFGVGDNWAGAAELAATEPLAAIVNMFWDGSNSAATYTGVDAPALQAFLPGLRKATGSQTRVTVQNTEDVQTSIALNFYNRDGTLVGTKNDMLPAKAEKTYYLDEVAECDFSATGGNGSLYVTSTVAKIATMASIHFVNGSAAYSGVSAGDTTVWVPGVFRKLSPLLFSAVTIQNLGNATANVTVNLLGVPGQPSHTFSTTIPAKASYGINTLSQGQMDATLWNNMVAAIGDNWQGSIKATADQPLAAAAFYFLPGAGINDILGYNAFLDSAATTGLSMPAVYRKVTGSPQQYSTTLVQNLDNTDGTINVKFYSAAGVQVGNVAGYDVNLPAGSSVRLHLGVASGLELGAQAITDLGNAFSGAMLIRCTTGQRIIGITNIIYSTLSRSSGYPGFPVD